MESSNQTNETKKCVWRTKILQASTVEILNKKIKEYIYKEYQPVFNTFQDTEFIATKTKMKTIIMARYVTQDRLEDKIIAWEEREEREREERRKKREEEDTTHKNE